MIADDFNDTHADFALVRYNQDGTLDTSFGDGGTVCLIWAAIQTSRTWKFATLPDGKTPLAVTRW